MSEHPERIVDFVDTSLRDAHQSLFATRMRTEEMVPILEELDHVGYHALEMWGGATFDACLRFLNEDPWERLRIISDHVRNTKLQMLLRGQNILGYRHYGDDVLQLFIRTAIKNGIHVIRIFDALNDVRNLEKSIEYTKQYGGHAQVAISYTTSPIHTPEYYHALVAQLMDHQVDSICIKDMAGLLTPAHAHQLVGHIKKTFSLPVEMHTHSTVGTASIAYLAAFEAGADLFDTACASLAGGTSQPPVEPLYYSFLEYPGIKLRLNSESFIPISDYFEKVRKSHAAEDVGGSQIDLRVLSAQVPGGMLSNLIHQLKNQKAMDKYHDVLAEIPRVRKDLGYPPLVTPTSQIVGVQAVFNVLQGRYRMITREVKAYCKGLYGRPPAPIDPELQALILGDEQPIDCRPADMIGDELPTLIKQAGHIASNDEDLLSLALFGEVARKFLLEKYFAKIGVDTVLLESSDDMTGVYPLS